MERRNSFLTAFSLLIACIVLAGISPHFVYASTNDLAPVRLHRGWRMQSSQKVRGTGEVISSFGYPVSGWHEIEVPSTVLAGQVASGEFQEPYFGMRLREIPGMTYPIGLNTFNNLPMDKDSPYAVPWWYRTEFRLPSNYTGRRVWLNFRGINYRSNVWLNGRKVANSNEVAGAYRTYEFDATSFLKPGETNVLALEVFAPTENDLGINWVDWNPAPPDKDMGIWGEVYLTASGPVSVRYPMVTTHFPSPEVLEQADLTVTAQLQNASDKPLKGILEIRLLQVDLRQEVALDPSETRSVSFTPEQFPELQIKNPVLWWPAQLGSPALHDVTVRFLANGAVSDQSHTRFGIREITSELTPERYRLFRVNGKRILIRGAAWAQDMMLRHSKERMAAEFEYVADMHLNTIRLEAQLGPDEFFDMADEKGLFVMAGWCCCDIWERWEKWTDDTLRVATTSLQSQALRLRGHPSLLVWLNGSDGPPPANVEQAYLDVLKRAAWPNPVLSSAADVPTTVSGHSGVKMSGPYDYVPPSYWLISKPPNPPARIGDTRYGGAFGYNTETSPGPAIPPLQSLKKMIPQDQLWPINDVWNYHSAGERFQTMDRFNSAMYAIYGRPANLQEYLLKAQAMAYDAERAMFEAYGGNKYTSTGVIQWMLNNAWPSTFWHLYDYFLYPAGGYFAAKKANEPLHVQYSYHDGSIVVANHRHDTATGLTVRTKVYDFELKELFSHEAKLDLEPDVSKRVVAVPPLTHANPGAVYFVKLSLLDSLGKEVSSNFYWLPAKLSAIDWEKAGHDTADAPIAEYEDLTALNALPRIRLKASALKSKAGDHVRVTLHNPNKSLAFQVHLGIRNHGSEDEVLPVLWEDNYISLMPGESKVLTAKYLKKNMVGERATLMVEGWNIEPVTVLVNAVR